MAGYLSPGVSDAPLTADQLNNNKPKDNQVSDPVSTLGVMARNKEAGYLTNPPEADRLKVLASVDPKTINRSWVEGFSKGQEDRRANSAMDMMQEKQSWSRTDRMEQRQIEAGMRQAAEEGGYEGVVDFLKVADPDKAIEFNSKKVALDQGMMKSDLMKSLLPVEQGKAMAEGYGVLGKMGMALMNAKPEDRQNMYAAMMPMIQKINPDAPKSLTDAVPMFMLGVAQATPENILFKSKNDISESTSRLGKIANDITIRLRAGYRPETDPGLQSLMAEQEKAKLGLQQAQLTLNNTEINQGIKGQTLDKQVMLANETINKNLQSSSKQFIEYFDTYRQAKGLMEQLREDPANAYAQVGLARTFVKMNNKGALTDADAETGFIAAGFPAMKKKIDAMVNGEKVALNPAEQTALIKVIDGGMQKSLQVQKEIEKGYETSATSEKYKDIISWKDVRKPSAMYDGVFSEKATNVPSINGKTASPEDIAAAAKDPKIMQDFIQYYGYDPTKPPQQQGGQQ